MKGECSEVRYLLGVNDEDCRPAERRCCPSLSFSEQPASGYGRAVSLWSGADDLTVIRMREPHVPGLGVTGRMRFECSAST